MLQFFLGIIAAPAIIGPTGPFEITICEEFDLQFEYDHSPDAFYAYGLPEGIELEESTGRLFGTPTEPGVYQAAYGAGSSAGITWEILDFVVLSECGDSTSDSESESETPGGACCPNMPVLVPAPVDRSHRRGRAPVYLQLIGQGMPTGGSQPRLSPGSWKAHTLPLPVQPRESFMQSIGAGMPSGGRRARLAPQSWKAHSLPLKAPLPSPALQTYLEGDPPPDRGTFPDWPWPNG